MLDLTSCDPLQAPMLGYNKLGDDVIACLSIGLKKFIHN